MDPSIPLFGVDSKINTGFLGYLQTFAIGTRTRLGTDFSQFLVTIKC